MRDGTLYEGTFKNGLMDGKMFVCEARGNEKINPRVEEYSGGTRINEYEESISEDLPEHWKAVIH